VLRYDWWEGEYYWEVLDHSTKSVQLDYCKDGMPFVASHRSYDADQQHGIVENCRVDKDRIFRGDVRFSRAERSQQIRQDLVDGIRKKVSVGYIVGDEFVQTEKKDGYPVRRYMAWMPLETSTVPVPADYNVGVGRAQSPDGQAAIARFLQLVPAKAPPVSDTAAESRAAAVPSATTQTPAREAKQEGKMEPDNAAPGTAPANVEPTSGNRAAPNVTDINARAAENAQLRIDNVTAMASQHGCSDKLSDWLRSGASELVVAREINKILEERMKTPIQQVDHSVIPERDLNRFSMARAVSMNTELESLLRQMPGGSKLDFGFEREMAQEMSRVGAGLGALGSPQKGGNLLPFQSLSKGARAGIDSGTSTTGAPFKFTQPGEFIPFLRNKTSVFRAGATVLTGLVGPLTMPKQTSATGTAWSAENPGSDISVTNLLTTTLTLSHKSIGAGTAFSRQMLFAAASGNFDIDAIVAADIAAVIGLALDLAGLQGGGSNQPTGVLGNTSIGSVTLGTHGGTISYNEIIDLETLIGDANADTNRMAYITNTKQRGRLKKLPVLANTVSGIPIWTGAPPEMDGVMNGYRAIVSNQAPRNLTKGTSTTVCSAIVFGAFEHLIFGMFGPGFETIVDPYSKKYQGLIEVSAWAYADCALRHDGAFAAVKDAL
jgi:HK97 family phage major capsid protein